MASTSESQMNLVQRESEICRFYLNGKCFYGDNCFNIHQGEIPQLIKKAKPPSFKATEKFTEDCVEEKGPSLRTAGDVRRRIQWDEILPEKDFSVGYLDRFEGVVEKPFSAFTWKHLATVDIDDLAIPEHRIQYFSYKGHKVWDKNEKLDHVYGSANNAKTIIEAMKDIDDSIQKQIEEDSSESEDEIDIVVGVNPVGATVNQIFSNITRATHFLCIKVSNSTLKEKVTEVQNYIVDNDISLNQCVMPSELLHITVAMVNCPTEESIVMLKNKLLGIKCELSKLESYSQSHTIHARRLKTFGSRVLYAELEVPPLFNDLVELIRSFIVKDPDLLLTNHFDFVPHMTLLKVNRPTSRLRRSKYIDSSLYQKYMDFDFGDIEIDNLQFCVIDDNRGIDGFYMTCSEAQI